MPFYERITGHLAEREVSSRWVYGFIGRIGVVKDGVDQPGMLSRNEVEANNLGRGCPHRPRSFALLRMTLEMDSKTLCQPQPSHQARHVFRGQLWSFRVG
jgi:hypothetical protein